MDEIELRGKGGVIYSEMGNFLEALANKKVTELKILTENLYSSYINDPSNYYIKDKYEGKFRAVFRNFLTGHITKDGFLGIIGNEELHGNSLILANTI